MPKTQPLALATVTAAAFGAVFNVLALLASLDLTFVTYARPDDAGTGHTFHLPGLFAVVVAVAGTTICGYLGGRALLRHEHPGWRGLLVAPATILASALAIFIVTETMPVF